jgi:hypothetical protein
VGVVLLPTLPVNPVRQALSTINPANPVAAACCVLLGPPRHNLVLTAVGSAGPVCQAAMQPVPVVLLVRRARKARIAPPLVLWTPRHVLIVL